MLIAPRFDIFEWVIGLLILIILLSILAHRKHTPAYLLFFVVFWVYLLALLNAVVFPLPEFREISLNDRQQWSSFILLHANLYPFNYGEFARFGYVFPEVISNILLTVPFGFGLNFIARAKLRDFLWIGIVLGFAIEAAQLAINLAWLSFTHVVDINDVILNAIGVLLGYAFFMLFARMFLLVTKHFGIEHKWLSADGHRVVLQTQAQAGQKTPDKTCFRQ